MMEHVILEFRNLSLGYQRETVVRDVSLKLRTGQTLGIVGESGSGKSTLLKSVLYPETFGIHILGGEVWYGQRRMEELSVRDKKALAGKEIGMIFQNPEAAFNPLRPLKKQFRESLASHGLWSRHSLKEIEEVFRKLNLPDCERIMESCPYEMSGGMNQRIGIALQLLLRPKLLLADEPTSALDVTAQLQVMEELARLKEYTGLSMVIVTHNMGAAARLCDQVAVMQDGRIVEYGKTEEVLLNPRHSYTKSLLKAVPVLRRRGDLEGDCI